MGDERVLQVAYFLEDRGHEHFIPPLVNRIADALQIRIENNPTTPSGYSRGSLIYQHFRSFIHDANRRLSADMLIVCVDEDCEGPTKKRHRFQSELTKAQFAVPVIYAIPKPYIEYWYLADIVNLCKVLGLAKLSFKVPDDQCNPAFYKMLLEKACADAGIESTGIEYGKDIVAALNLQGAMKHHPARTFIEEARQALYMVWQRLNQQP